MKFVVPLKPLDPKIRSIVNVRLPGPLMRPFNQLLHESRMSAPKLIASMIDHCLKDADYEREYHPDLNKATLPRGVS